VDEGEVTMAGRIRIGAYLTIFGLGASLLVAGGAHAAPDPTVLHVTLGG
jgi:hypothetical protein